jgi:hypothetical protein
MFQTTENENNNNNNTINCKLNLFIAKVNGSTVPSFIPSPNSHTMSMQSLIVEPPTEREKREHFELKEKQAKSYSCSMRQYGQLDEDTPVTIPIVPTNFILQPVLQQSSHNDTTSGIPPLPSGRYKKHSSDPTRNNPHLLPIPSSSSLSRSKSCGEGRSSEPSNALDVLSRKANTERLGSGASLIDKFTQVSTRHYRDDNGFEPPKLSTAGNFKCNVFCVSLPGLSSKKKPMQGRSESHSSSNSVESDNISKNNMYIPDLETNAGPATRPSVISKVASLERFDLSISSDIFIDCSDERHGSSYFDLPMELIGSSEDDTDLPVNSAFLFENDHKTGRRKKKSNSSSIASDKTSYEMPSRRSNNSRTSSSSKVSNASSMRSSRSLHSSACVMPKIIKREELDALLEAQST